MLTGFALLGCVGVVVFFFCFCFYFREVAAVDAFLELCSFAVGVCSWVLEPAK